MGIKVREEKQMQENKSYTKLSALVDDTFKVEKVFGYKFKMWDNNERKMLISDTWVKGYQKKYTLETDKGVLDLSAGQMGNLLEAITSDGRADINGRTFLVKSNGKSGMDIRYYINATKEAPEAPKEPTEDIWSPTAEQDAINVDDIPF